MNSPRQEYENKRKLFFENSFSVYTKENMNIHEYSSVQTALNIIHQYIFLDNQNPAGRESTSLLYYCFIIIRQHFYNMRIAKK